MSSRLDTVSDWAARAERAHFRVATLAGQCEVTERQLRRYFRAKFGMSPNLWLTTARLEMIPPLLQRGKTVKEVAAQTGFSRPENLTRSFKQKYKITPSSLRNARAVTQNVRY